MTDAASTNISALESLDLTFALCRFHVSERWKKHLRGIPSKQQEVVARSLVLMGVAKNEHTYLKEFESFSDYCQQNKETHAFFRYFKQKFHRCHKAWTAERSLLFMNSIGNTNNVTENQIRLLEQECGERVIQRIDYLVPER